MPAERIAQIPPTARDGSKLLVVKGPSVSEDLFTSLPDLLPPGCLLVLNDTRVIRARLLFRKPTGGTIEIFCLDPVEPSEPETAFHATGHSTWKCLVGNSKRWKGGVIELRQQGDKATGHRGTEAPSTQAPWSPGPPVTLTATRLAGLDDGTFAIRFSWEPEELTFAGVIETLGHIPLPPYIHREDTPQDNERYQTIYAARDGSVAAPTAGLHFTPSVIDGLRRRGCILDYVTLHVGAGTFKPVTETDVARHIMHREKVGVTRDTVRNLAENRNRGLVVVGTTAARTLESLYWAGVKIIRDGTDAHPEVGQWDPYNERYDCGIPVSESLSAMLDYLHSGNRAEYRAETQLMILPGYRFRLADGLITNFHMPGSTLLMLVSAFAGDVWKEAYRYALARDFRFLSYGDACLFLK